MAACEHISMPRSLRAVIPAVAAGRWATKCMPGLRCAGGSSATILFKSPVTRLSGSKRRRRPPQRCPTPHPNALCKASREPAGPAGDDAEDKAEVGANLSRARLEPPSKRQRADGNVAALTLEESDVLGKHGATKADPEASQMQEGAERERSYDGCGKQQPGTTPWEGVVKQRVNNTVVELLRITADIPIPYADQFPPSLYISDMLHLRNVFLGRHDIVKCQLSSPSARQLRKLKQLAKSELVAVVRLQLCTLVLCPFQDGSEPARMVGFLLTNMQ